MAGEKSQNLEKRVVSGMFWKFLEQISYQGIQLLFSILLLRMLSKEDVGAVGIISIFIGIANSLIQTGFSQALMQKKEVKNLDYSTAFLSSLALATLLYLVFFFLSPYVAAFYHLPVLTGLLRLMALLLFPGAILSIQLAHASRALSFRPIFLCSFLSSLFSGILAIVFAKRGFGAYAMAYQQVFFTCFSVLILFILLPYKPGFGFSLRSLQSLFAFSWKLILSGIVDQIWQNIYALLIGKKYSVEELALYNRGEMFPKLISGTLSSLVSSVLFPAFSKLQGEKEKLLKGAQKSVSLSAFLLFPLLFGLMAVGKPLIVLLLTEKWLGLLPYLYFLSLVYLLFPLHMINLQLMSSQGRSDLFLKIEMQKKIVGVLILVMTLPFGLFPFLWGKIIGDWICFYLNTRPNKKLLNYGFFEQLREVLPSIFAAVFMAALVFLSGKYLEKKGVEEIFQLLILIPLGGISYLIFSFLWNRENLFYSFSLFRLFRSSR